MSELTDQFVALVSGLTDLSPIMPQIGEIWLTSVHRNFAEGGRFGSEPFGGGSEHWIPSKDGGKTLERSGGLEGSITVTTAGNEATLQSSHPAAAIQNYGGVAGIHHSVTIPAHPFAVLQSEDLVRFVDVIAEHYAKLLG